MANEFIQWLSGLEREYVFLLALPFVVAVIGLWSWWVDQEDIDREYEARAEQARAEQARAEQARAEQAHAERRRAERRKGERRHGGNSRITA